MFAPSDRARSLLAFCALLLTVPHPTSAIRTTSETLIPYTESDGTVIYLVDNRQPAVYSEDFADCLGGSLVDMSRFDVAYYKDNQTVSFHLQGTTALQNQSVMVYLEIYAYGTNYWSMLFDPCQIQADNLCPVNQNATIQANGVLPISDSEADLIPAIALSIPDFEGQAIIRMFSNNSRSEIACYATTITNGHTFSHPEVVGPILGGFTIMAVLASFLIATSAGSTIVTRKHYAHSMSVLVIFEVFHHIYFTGALSMNWPRVLPAFWSNYAWAAGMIYTQGMEDTISRFVGSNAGSLARVGAPAAGLPNDGIGGGYSLSSIYGGDLDTHAAARALSTRGLPDVSTGFIWYGAQAAPGAPFPGTSSSFAGTLAAAGGIPASNAFMTGFLWFLVILASVVVLLTMLKWMIEGLAYLYLTRRDRMAFFRAHWIGYVGMAFFRTLMISFFAITFLSLFQLAYGGSGGVTAVAALTFLVLTFGVISIALYACYVRVRFGRHNTSSELQPLDTSTAEYCATSPNLEENNNATPVYTYGEEKTQPKTPFWKISVPAEGRSAHDNEEFTREFGWLTARYKGSRWWFFMFWLIYQFLRACFLAGAIARPLVQVFGLLVIEIIAFAGVIYVRPYESERLNALVVYALGFSKVITTALTASFDVSFNLPRIEATAIGVVIAVIQGILTLLLIAAICSSLITSYFSLSRSGGQMPSARLNDMREKYFLRLDNAALELPKHKLSKEEKLKMKVAVKEEAMEASPVPRPIPEKEPTVAAPPYFRLGSVRRLNKIEDEADASSSEGDDDVQQLDILFDKSPPTPQRRTTQNSIRSSSSVKSRSSLPYGARELPRRSWSTRDNFRFSDDQSKTAPSQTVRSIESSDENLNSLDKSSIPPVPSLPPSPYLLEDVKTKARPIVRTTSMSSAESVPTASRPRSVTLDYAPLDNILETSVRPQSSPRPGSSIHASLIQQELPNPAIAAARQAVQRQLSVRSQRSTNDSIH